MGGLKLDGQVLGNTTFALSPLAEVTASLWRHRDGVAQPAADRRWRDDARRRVPLDDLELLDHVVPRVGAVAAFMIPATTATAASIEDQLGVLAATPAEALSNEFAELWSGAPLPAPLNRLLSHGEGAGQLLADAVERYWSLAMLPHWPRILALLEDDIAQHMAVARRNGLTALLTGIHPCMGVEAGVLRFRSAAVASWHGERLRLVPSVFLSSKILVNGARPDVIELTYGAFGAGRLWTSTPPVREDPLDALLGRSRATVLVELTTPAYTTQLVGRLGYSPATTSRHLSVLTKSGLVTRWRFGRVVWYHQTPLGESLVQINRRH